MHHTHTDPFIEELTELTGQDPSQCYQCGKCSAGCPVREYMDEAPNRIVRYVQLGLYDKALYSSTIWLCAGCQTCSSRCPKDFHLAHFMDAMRELALKKDIEPAEKRTVEFLRAFLNRVKANGRLHEVGLVAEYKLRTFDLMKDVTAAPGMFLKGKLSILPHQVKDKEKIKKIFNQK